MQDSQRRYFRIALFARLDCGVWSLPWRAKEALEARGHTVFLFEPRAWPQLFSPEGRVCAGELRRFFEVQRPDCLLVAEGLGLADAVFAQGAGVACGMLCATRAEAESSVALSRGELSGAAHGAFGEAPFDFALTVSRRSLKVREVEGFAGVVEACPALPDTAYAQTPLANDIAFGPGVLCLQDASPSRVAHLRGLIAEGGEFSGCAVRCAGEGWPEEWKLDASYTGLAYASRASRACVVFDPDASLADARCTDFALALARVDGVPFAGEGAAALPAPDAAAGAASLDEFLDRALSSLRARFSECDLMPGVASPREVACVLGYFGMGNFGDEYILATIDARLRAARPGFTVVAVGENPVHTLRARGIYSITMRDKLALDAIMRHSCVALVAAGLLFDQGIRWTMGKAELASSMLHTDIPGIAAYVELAYLNGAKPLFYGIGAGPLDVADGRDLVRLMGALGARFITRDEGTASLMRACGVPAQQVEARADVAFLGSSFSAPFVDEWLSSVGFDETSDRLVVLSLRDYENVPADFAERIARALTGVAKAHPSVRFAACVLDPSDRDLAERVRTCAAGDARVDVFDAGEAVEPVACLLSRATAGLSMRYHCSLLLAAAGAPCVGLGYLPKVVSLYSDLGADDMLLSMDASAADIEGALARLLSERDERARKLALRVAHLRRKSAEAERELIGEVEKSASAKHGALPKAFFLERASRRDIDEGRLRAELERERARADAAEAERDAALREVVEYEGSRSYRVGRAVTAVPRALRGLARGGSRE